MPTSIMATVRIADPERFTPCAKGLAGLGEYFGDEAIVMRLIEA